MAARRPAPRRDPSSDLAVCGIAGVLDRSGAPVDRSSVLQRMSEVIAHRGPDDEGQLRRRAGRPRQPPARDHRPVAGRRTCRWRAPTARSSITYNGEVYNFRELRAELERARPRVPLAHRHRGRAPRLRRSGAPACVERFNGMFAFAIWDRRPRASCSSPATASASSRSTTRTPAARSLFGSEIKAMLAHDALRRAGQPAAPARVLHVPEHLHRRHAVRRRQAAAARATASRSRRTAARSRRERYWDFDFREPDGGVRPTRSTRRSSTGSSARPSSASS